MLCQIQRVIYNQEELRLRWNGPNGSSYGPFKGYTNSISD